MYHIEGKGVKQDYTHALSLFKTAEKIDSTVVSGLAYMYENGFGVDKDIHKALKLYKKNNSFLAKKKIKRLLERINSLGSTT